MGVLRGGADACCTEAPERPSETTRGCGVPKLPSRVNLDLRDPCGDCFCCQRQEELERYLQEVVSFQPCPGEAIEELYNLLDVSPEIRAQILFPLLPLEESKTFRGASYLAPTPTRKSVSWRVKMRRPRGKRPQQSLDAVLFSWNLGEGIDLRILPKAASQGGCFSVPRESSLL